MSGLLRTLVFGDFGNWHHSLENQEINVKQRNHIRRAINENYAIDADQEKRIIQLEVLCGALLGMLRENDVLTNEEIEAILASVEQSTEGPPK